MTTFPKQIIVTRDKDRGDEWFTVYEHYKDLEHRDGELVGVYKLVETSKVKIDITLI